MNTQGIERIADSLGFLVLTEEGAVHSSGGDLENDERIADKFMSILKTSLKVSGEDEKTAALKRISVICESYMYVVTLSNSKVYISKRRCVPQEPVQV